MFSTLARLVTTRPRLIIILLIIATTIAAGTSYNVVSRLTPSGFEDPKAESFIVSERLRETYKTQPSNLILLVEPKHASIDDPAVQAEVTKIEKKLAAKTHIERVTSYWSAGKIASLKADDGSSALILATIAGTEAEMIERAKTINPHFFINNDTVKVSVGGVSEINRQYTLQIEHDLQIAELLAFPLTALLLVIVFRSVIAATLPLLIGGFAIVGTFFALHMITGFTDASIYALNLTTMMGLGLAIDYSLFMVSRFREQLAKGMDTADAVQHTVMTAGRTVAFSALTVGVSLAAMIVFPVTFLQSFAYAGLAVALVAAVGALVLLPAILMLLGKRINALSLGRTRNYERGSLFWHTISLHVMKRPGIITVSVIAALLVTALPFLQINPGRGDERGLPKNNSAHIVHDTIRSHYSARTGSTIQVLGEGAGATNPTKITQFAKDLSRLPHVDHVESAVGIFIDGHAVAPALPGTYTVAHGSRLDVIPTVDAATDQGLQLVRDIRALKAPFTHQVGGYSALIIDLNDTITTYLPWAGVIIMIAMIILFFFAFGSVFLPIKAILTAVLSLSASFGMIVWVFQDGNLSNLLNFTPTGMIDATMPVLIFCVAFGLSMDYEMFLLSRIKEEHDNGADTTASVAHGLEKTGGIVSAAAISISVVFLAFATSGVALIKMVGLGLAIAVLLDAFLIRGTLVPAFMRLAGGLNWWAPKPLKKLYSRFSISE